MKRRNGLIPRLFAFIAVISLLAGIALPASAQTKRRRSRARTSTRPAPPPVKYYNVEAGQVIRVRMNSLLSSETARVGDVFTTTTVDPVYSEGVEVIPAGSIVSGRVTEVTRAGRQRKAGTLGVDFESLQLPNGTSRALNGSLTEQTNGDVTYDNEGGVTGGSSTKRNVVFIGGGAAAGALIGAIAGGGKGAGIGAGVGAGLGVAGAYFSKGKEAVVKPGTEFGVILNRSISLAASNAR